MRWGKGVISADGIEIRCSKCNASGNIGQMQKSKKVLLISKGYKKKCKFIAIRQ